MTERATPQPAVLALIAAQAFTLVNFRGTLIASLVGKGIAVHALAPDYDDTMRETIRRLGAVPVDYGFSRTGMNPLRDVKEAARLAVQLRRLGASHSLAYGIKPATFGTLAAWFAGVPRRYVMIEGLGYLFTPADRGQKLKRWLMRGIARRLYRTALSRADRVFFLNEDDIAEFTRSSLVKHGQITKLGATGVDLRHWAAEPAIREPVTFVMAARLLREKGVTQFAEAARRVKALHPHTRFILLGALDANPGAVSMAELRAWTWDGAIEWPGHVEVAPWLKQASVFVLPSYYREGVPRSTQEAMALARPVITTDVPGCRETVVEGRNGFLVPARDVEALAAAMLRFVRKPDLIETMGRVSRMIAEERFDARKADGLIWRTMFEDVAGSPPAPEIRRRRQ